METWLVKLAIWFLERNGYYRVERTIKGAEGALKILAKDKP